jgi:hypothetical protein
MKTNTTLRYSYRVIGMWKTGQEVGGTYGTYDDAMARVEELRKHPGIEAIKLLTFETTTRFVGDEVFTPRKEETA